MGRLGSANADEDAALARAFEQDRAWRRSRCFLIPEGLSQKANLRWWFSRQSPGCENVAGTMEARDHNSSLNSLRVPQRGVELIPANGPRDNQLPIRKSSLELRSRARAHADRGKPRKPAMPTSAG
jgi:hypothetical protein